MLIGGKDRTIVSEPIGADRPQSDLPEMAESGVSEDPEGAGTSSEVISPRFSDRTPDVSKAPQEMERIRGSGTFYDGEERPKPPAVTQSGGTVSLNFVDADVRDVIKTVLGSTLGQNFTIDPKVKGTITLQTSNPIPRSAVLSTLESALSLNGLALVRTGDLYQVTSSRSAVRSAVRPRISGMTGSTGEAYGVEILPLEFAGATEMAQIIEPLAPSGAVLRTDTARNLLIVGGTQHERETIAEIVAIFDVDWMAGMSFALIPLEFAPPKEAIADLERVFGTNAGGPLEGLVRFFPVDRRQSVLVISAKASYIERARSWIKLLDVGGEDQKRLYVYAVENARATDLAEILSQVFSDAPVSTPSRSVAPEQRSARVTTRQSRSGSTSPTSVTAQAFGPPISAAQAAPAPAPTGGSVPRATAAPPSRARITPSTGRAADSQGSNLVEGSLPEELAARIIPDDVNNSLVVMARPGVWRMILDTLRKLDVVPLQVLIEATIAEVRLNDSLRYGVQSFFQSGNRSVALAGLAGQALAAPAAGFSFIYDTGNIKAILDALDSVTDFRIISSPQVVVLDNRTAELTVGDQVPISTQQSISNVDPDAPTVNSVEYRDTGVVLRVTPRVNASGVVNLEIEQEISNVASTTETITPTITQRKVSSTVVVNSGETVALGGLISNSSDNTKSGVPLLSSIPILGALFSSTTESRERNEILVLITPKVIRNQEEARAVTRELRQTLHNAAALTRNRNNGK